MPKTKPFSFRPQFHLYGRFLDDTAGVYVEFRLNEMSFQESVNGSWSRFTGRETADWVDFAKKAIEKRCMVQLGLSREPDFQHLATGLLLVKDSWRTPVEWHFMHSTPWQRAKALDKKP